MSRLTSAYPPPWTLDGHGFIFLHRLGSLSDDGLPAPLQGRFARGIGAVMLVEYTSSNVGPYRELVYIPGQFQTPRGRSRSISHIWVTSEASVEWGRRNWAFPKQLADIRWTTAGDVERIEVHREGQRHATFEVRRGRDFALPITSALIPRRIRTLTQPRDSGWCQVVPHATGRISRTTLETVDTRALLPGLDPGCLTSAWHVRSFRLTFPAAIG